MALTNDEISGRIRVGEQYMQRFVRNDRTASARFRDPTVVAPYTEELDRSDGGDVPQEASVGHGSLTAINVITKVAGIAIGDPDWHMEGEPPDALAMARKYLRRIYRANNMKRAVQAALLKRYLSGLGCVAYRWDRERGPVLEHVQSWDLSIDPSVSDWQRMKWAARRVKMTRRSARARYGEEAFPLGGTSSVESLDRETVDVWVYWDNDTEAHVYDKKVLNPGTENLYERVPLLFLEGDIDPGPSMFPLGDSQMTLGLQQQITDLTQQISNIAKNGGPLNLINEQLVSKSVEDALRKAQENGWIGVKDMPDRAFLRVSGEELPAAVVEAKRDAQLLLDSMTGVTQYMRGTVTTPAKFATEAAMTAQQSGSRGVQARIEFEEFMDRVAEILVWLSVQFGGPDEETGQASDQSAVMTWYALQAIESIHVVESSTMFRDPSQDLQQAMQLFNLVVASMQIFTAMPQQGVPNLRAYLEDVLRAAGRRDTRRYWTQLQQGVNTAMEGAPAPETASPQIAA